MHQDEQVERSKKLLLEALEKCLGVVSEACKLVDISRSNYYYYYNSDEEFKEAVIEIQKEMVVDVVESKLFELIRDGHPSSIHFFLKCRGKHRGYHSEIGSSKLQAANMAELIQKMLAGEIVPKLAYDAAKTIQIQKETETLGEIIDVQNDLKKIIKKNNSD